MQPNNEVMNSMISDAVSYQQIGGRSDTMRSMKPIVTPPQLQQNVPFRTSSVVSFHSENSGGSANSQESANFGGINLKNHANNQNSDKTPTT